jgi:hypothetical protein
VINTLINDSEPISLPVYVYGPGVGSTASEQTHIVAHVDAKMASAINGLDQKSAPSWWRI